MREHENKSGSLHEKALGVVKQSLEGRGADPASNKRFMERWGVWLIPAAKMINHLGGGRPMARRDTIS